MSHADCATFTFSPRVKARFGLVRRVHAAADLLAAPILTPRRKVTR